jgi:uncharacterized protein YyaL (SSP411 family)
MGSVVTHEERAIAFAANWYQRPESGRDETTLAYLVSVQIRAAAEAATLAERERIAANLAKLTRP